MLLVYPLTLELVKKNIVCKEINRLIIRDKLTAKTVFFSKREHYDATNRKKNPKSFGNMFSSTRPRKFWLNDIFIKHLFNSITFNIMLCI